MKKCILSLVLAVTFQAQGSGVGPCAIFLKDPVVDLTPLVKSSDIFGTEVSKNRWILGEGSEAMVERVRRENGFGIVKHFFYPALAQTNFDLFELIKTFEIQSFKLPEGVEVKGNSQTSPWIEGVSLDKILENPKIPEAVKEKLWNLYQDRLVLLVHELTNKRPDFFFQVNQSKIFTEMARRISPRVNLYFRELDPVGANSKARFMIEVYKEEDQNDDKADVLEPKPDNILLDLKTWDMTWIDPN